MDHYCIIIMDTNGDKMDKVIETNGPWVSFWYETPEGNFKLEKQFPVKTYNIEQYANYYANKFGATKWELIEDESNTQV